MTKTHTLEEIHEAYFKARGAGPDKGQTPPEEICKDERLRTFIDESGLNRTLSIVVTTKCPLRCSHCPIGIYGEPKDVPIPRINEEDIKRAIRTAKKYGYKLANFVGGEPMHAIDLVAAGLKECIANDMGGFIVTAPVWASTKEKALKNLSKLKGLHCILLSYDKYHLEYLDLKHYDNAIDACNQLGIDVTMNVCFTRPEEKEELHKELSHFSGRVKSVQFIPYVPLGNVKESIRDLPFTGVTINEAGDIDQLERTCTIGAASVGLYKDVFACCWSMAAMNSPIRFDKRRSGNFEKDLMRMEQDENVRHLRKTGVINSLTPEKKEKIFNAVKGKKFVNECHMCLYLLEPANGNLWRKYVSVS
jgi:hypothetical protein